MHCCTFSTVHNALLHLVVVVTMHSYVHNALCHICDCPKCISNQRYQHRSTATGIRIIATKQIQNKQARVKLVRDSWNRHNFKDTPPRRWRSQNASYLTEVNMHSSVTRQYKNGKWRQVQWLNNTFIFTHYMFLVLKSSIHSNKLWPCCSLSTSKTLYLFQKVSNFADW